MMAFLIQGLLCYGSAPCRRLCGAVRCPGSGGVYIEIDLCLAVVGTL